MGKSIGIWNDFRRGFAREIYNNRKKLGLFTLDDIEIDVEKVEDIMCDEVRKNKTFKEMAKAIADKRPIKIKE